MYVNFLSTYSDKKSCHTATTLQTSIARFVSDSWASCWKCADAGHQKLSKLVHACRNYSLPKLARFLCRMTNAHPSWSLKLGTHWRVTTNLTESTFDFVAVLSRSTLSPNLNMFNSVDFVESGRLLAPERRTSFRLCRECVPGSTPIPARWLEQHNEV